MLAELAAMAGEDDAEDEDDELAAELTVRMHAIWQKLVISGTERLLVFSGHN